MGAAVESYPGAWGRRRLLVVLGAVGLAASVLVVGLGFAVYFGISAAADGPADGPPPSAPGATGVTTPTPGTPQGQDHRDAVAAAPMLGVGPGDSRPDTPAAVVGPTITVPAATTAGPAQVPAGFPPTPQGAVGQLAAIETTVLNAMSVQVTNDVHRGWVLPGGPAVADWEMTRNVQSFLETAQMTSQKDTTTTVAATPAAGLVKGTDGTGWVLACVLLDVQATIRADARMGYGHCARMQWTDGTHGPGGPQGTGGAGGPGGRWMIAPGAAPARAPSTWPGSELSQRAGWATWVDQGRG